MLSYLAISDRKGGARESVNGGQISSWAAGVLSPSNR